MSCIILADVQLLDTEKFLFIFIPKIPNHLILEDSDSILKKTEWVIEKFFEQKLQLDLHLEIEHFHPEIQLVLG